MKPVGQVTRGTTGSNRLRRFDRWISHLASRELASGAPTVVDVGFGASPATTVEWQRCLHRLNSGIEVIGVEIDRARVAAARDLITAVHGGFEIPVPGNPLIIRAANVLRQYDALEVPGAWQIMQRRLAPGGWLIDGTCDEQGRLASMLSLDPEHPVWFTMSVRLAGLERPSQVAARLPKVLIHRNVAGTAIHEFLRDLDAGWDRGSRWGARQRWIEAVTYVAPRWQVRDDPRRWRLGEVTIPAQAVLCG